MLVNSLSQKQFIYSAQFTFAELITAGLSTYTPTKAFTSYLGVPANPTIARIVPTALELITPSYQRTVGVPSFDVAFVNQPVGQVPAGATLVAELRSTPPVIAADSYVSPTQNTLYYADFCGGVPAAMDGITCAVRYVGYGTWSGADNSQVLTVRVYGRYLAS